MPDYTPGGIEFPLFSDWIKHDRSTSALADDFKALAFSADNHANTVAGTAKTEAIEDATTKYGGLPGRVTSVEEKNTQQDSRLSGLEALRPTKSVRLEGGKWVWDLAGATHYVLLDHTGAPAVRATPWPKPNPTKPEFDW